MTDEAARSRNSKLSRLRLRAKVSSSDHTCSLSGRGECYGVEHVSPFSDIAQAESSSRPSSLNPREPISPPMQSSPTIFPLGSPVRDVPLSRKDGAKKCRLGSRKAKQRYARHAEEARKVIIGPMPVEEFLDKFLPVVEDDKPMPDATGAFDDASMKPATKFDISKYLIWTINQNGRCPNVELIDTSVTAKANRLGAYKPDITGYDPRVKKLLDPIKVGQVKEKETLNGATMASEETKQRPEADEGGKTSERIVKQGTEEAPMNDRQQLAKSLPRFRAHLGLADIYFEVNAEYDPFFDEHDHRQSAKNREHFVGWENYGNDSRGRSIREQIFGRMVSYVAEACARQNRMFYFSVLVVGTRARFFRWDRAGVIVTRSFDYREQPELLCKFLWRFGHANPVQRGFDPTVTPASPEERDLFEKVISAEVKFQLNVGADDTANLQEAVNLHLEKGKVNKMWVYNKTTSQWEEYLVSVPLNSPRSAVGRSSRAYWSVKVVRDSDEGMRGVITFLKDSWRIEVPKMGDEGSVYRDIGAKVRKIPKIVAYGDVPQNPGFHVCDKSDAPSKIYLNRCLSKQVELLSAYQCTRTQEFTGSDWVCSYFNSDNHKERIIKHTHFRMTLDEVGYSLKHFVGSRELFGAIRDTFEALDSAYQSCSRLHRDVSVDNIILVRSKKTNRREGRLVDWEFSTIVDQHGKARDHYRIGTWAFMSAAVLDRLNNSFQHSHEDDLESLLYVSMYCSLLWLPRNGHKGLGKWLSDFFDESSMFEGHETGGDKKVAVMARPGSFARTIKFSNEHIQRWFTNVYQDLNAIIVKDDLSKFTSIRFGQHLDDVCRGLESLGWEEGDRVECDVGDYYVEKPTVRYSTQTSVVPSRAGTSEVLVSDAEVPGREHRGSKRSLVEADDGQLDNASSGGSHRAKKRSRSSLPNGCD